MATTQLQIKRDTAANWTSADTVLALAEPGYESDTGKLKFGDGSTAWTSLAYNYSGLTEAEFEQLENIGTTTISAAQWAYLGALDQALTTGSNVSFNQMTDGTITITGGNITGATGITATNLTGTLQTAAQANITSLGTLTALDSSGTATIDTINEHTGAAGVTIETVLIKDGLVDGVNISAVQGIKETEIQSKVNGITIIEDGAIYTFDDWDGTEILQGSADQTSGTVTTGLLYVIKTFQAGDDFSNIGGTNVSGTKFYATGATPTTWTNSSVLYEVGFAMPVPYKKSLSNVYTGYETIKYEGNGKNTKVTFDTCPGLHIVKNIDNANESNIYDLFQGIGWNLYTSASLASTKQLDGVKAIGDDYITVGELVQCNTMAQSYVMWNWSYPVAVVWHANTDGATGKEYPTPWGAITSIQGNASDDMASGQYVIELYNPLTRDGMLVYYGTGVNRLLDFSGGVAPEFMIAKDLTNAVTSIIYHSQLDGGTAPEDFNLVLNTTAAEVNAVTAWNDIAPNANLISLGTGNGNTNAALMVLYYFAPNVGLQNFGGYAGNAGVNNQATGCKDGMFFTKIRAGGVANWSVYDDLRGADNALNWNLTAVESVAGNVGFNATSGIDLSGADADVNAAADDYVYGHFGKEMVIQDDFDVFPVDSISASGDSNDEVVITFEYGGSATLNTELLLYATREATPNWVLGSMSQIETLSGGVKLITATIDISGNAAGTAMRWRLASSESGSETEHNISNLKIRWY